MSVEEDLLQARGLGAIRCQSCQDHGALTCPTCNGAGIDGDPGDERQCEDCAGAGTVECPFCPDWPTPAPCSACGSAAVFDGASVAAFARHAEAVFALRQVLSRPHVVAELVDAADAADATFTALVEVMEANATAAVAAAQPESEGER